MFDFSSRTIYVIVIRHTELEATEVSHYYKNDEHVNDLHNEVSVCVDFMRSCCGCQSY